MSLEHHPRRKVVGISVPIKLAKMLTSALLECGHVARYMSRIHPKSMICKECPKEDPRPMNPNDRAQRVTGWAVMQETYEGDIFALEERIAKEISDAVAEEREACAEIVEETVISRIRSTDLALIAERIRNRGAR